MSKYNAIGKKIQNSKSAKGRSAFIEREKKQWEKKRNQNIYWRTLERRNEATFKIDDTYGGP